MDIAHYNSQLVFIVSEGQHATYGVMDSMALFIGSTTLLDSQSRVNWHSIQLIVILININIT